MYPVLFELGGVAIPSWHVFFVLGAMASYFALLHLSKHFISDVPELLISRLFAAGYIGGYFGARLLSIFIEEPDVKGFMPTLEALFKLGPMTMYGGLIGCFLCGFIYCLWRKLPIPEIASVAFVAGFLGVGIGRIGCFLNGDDFGAVVPMAGLTAAPWWSVTFPNHQDPLPRYPVQLIEAVFCIVLSLLFMFKFQKLALRLGVRWVGIGMLALYCVFRFIIEYWRGDERGWVIPKMLSPSQLISVLILILLVLLRTYTSQSRSE